MNSCLTLLSGLQNSKNLLAQSSQVSATFTALTVAIPSMNQSASSLGISHKALDSSIKWSCNVTLEICQRLLSGLARASGIVVNGCAKASPSVLNLPTSNPNT